MQQKYVRSFMIYMCATDIDEDGWCWHHDGSRLFYKYNVLTGEVICTNPRPDDSEQVKKWRGDEYELR